jgi:hypothetical protein
MARQTVTIEVTYDPATTDAPQDWTWGVGVELDAGTVRLVAAGPVEDDGADTGRCSCGAVGWQRVGSGCEACRPNVAELEQLAEGLI